MANVSGTLTLSGTISEKNASGVPISNGLTATVSVATKYANGTGAGQTDLLYSVPYTISTATTIDLTALSDIISGQAVDSDFARVRELIVVNNDATHDLKVEAGASNGWAMLPPSATPLFARANGGLVRVSDPQSTGTGIGNVVTGTSKTVTFDPGSNTIQFSLLVAGCSVA